MNRQQTYKDASFYLRWTRGFSLSLYNGPKYFAWIKEATICEGKLIARITYVHLSYFFEWVVLSFVQITLGQNQIANL